VDERLRFVARVKEGESVVDLCREFGISRKTGHKILKRYREQGLLGLEDQRRSPKRIPHKTEPEVVALVVEARKTHASWGPKKLKAWLERKHEGIALPAASTIGAWLKREGLVKSRPRRRRCPGMSPTELTPATAPNDVWCADFKGQFKLGNGRYCYPLTITDQHSRFLVSCEALEGVRTEGARWVFEEAFRECGLPRVIRTDNGAPFATTALGGLSALSAWWLRLGIRPERIEPAHPEQNGQHERMHLTLKQETTRPAAANALQQQERFDDFKEEFNKERPHEALDQQPPATIYVPSERRYPDEVPELEYPLHDLARAVGRTGFVQLNRVKFFLTQALAGQHVGLREVDDGKWLVSYVQLDLGHYDERTQRFECFSELSPMCPVCEEPAEGAS
jgi:transposase InsO family protein